MNFEHCLVGAPFPKLIVVASQEEATLTRLKRQVHQAGLVLLCEMLGRDAPSAPYLNRLSALRDRLYHSARLYGGTEAWDDSTLESQLTMHDPHAVILDNRMRVGRRLQTLLTGGHRQGRPLVHAIDIAGDFRPWMEQVSRGHGDGATELFLHGLYHPINLTLHGYQQRLSALFRACCAQEKQRILSSQKSRLDGNILVFPFDTKGA